VQGRVFYDLNGNGVDDTGEPGVGGETVQLNEKQSVETDTSGRFQFSAKEGEYNIVLVTEDLGVRLRASTVTQQKVSVYPHKNTNVSFGVSDFGFISGHVFNDLSLSGVAPASNIQGVSGVKIILRSRNIIIAELKTPGNGIYEFQNLRPGNYTLEIDASTLPANFRLPAQISREIKVEAVQGFYLDIPIAAQRAVSGIVFVDKDGDGKFSLQIDEPIEGAFVSIKNNIAISDKNGAYILRNLAAGKMTLLVRHPHRASGISRSIELDEEPDIKQEVNLLFAR
jgi:hypothetical protein